MTLKNLMAQIKWRAKSIDNLRNAVDLKEISNALNKDWEMENKEKKLRQHYENGLLSDEEFDRMMEEIIKS